MTENKTGILYLIPSNLGENTIDNILVKQVKEVVDSLTHFIVENDKTARKFLKEVGIITPQNQLSLYVYEKRTPAEEWRKYLKLLEQGTSVGLLSEAGCPAVADPGAEIVKLAHQKDIRVMPLVGASSIMLSLMASGFNGQSFTFNGYLPIDRPNRIQRIKELEKLAQRNRQTQIFIETPYRNNHLIEDIIKTCSPTTLLSISCDLTTTTEFIKTQTIAQWQNHQLDLHKRPAIFLLYSNEQVLVQKEEQPKKEFNKPRSNFSKQRARR